MKSSIFLIILMSLISTRTHAQISNFTLQITKTNETCPGNGSLNFSVSNTVSGSSVIYKIFQLPDSENPISIQESSFIGSLPSGTYRVAAIQSVGSQSHTVQQDVTILNAVPLFDFSVGSANEICVGGGSIICTTTVGEIVSYEIVSGPETRPVQSSNSFHNLPQGIYNVRAFDACGTGKVKTYSLILYDGELQISDVLYPEGISQNCNFITVNNIIKPTAGTIPYPVTVEHTFDILNIQGNPITFAQIYETGSPESLEVSVVVPRAMGYNSTYSIRVNDNCGSLYEKNDIVVDNNISLALSAVATECFDNYLVVKTGKVAAPYTMNFLSAPEGFNPQASSTAYGNSITETTLTFGNENTPVPSGIYVVQVSDACGRSVTEEIEIELNLPEPEIRAYNGCMAEFGNVKIRFEDFDIISAVIISAPSAYVNLLPHDVSQWIDDDHMFFMRDLPLGNYIVEITDSCGHTQQVEFVVPPFTYRPFTLAARPGCATGYGTIYSESGNDMLVSMVMIAAPSSFEHPLPHDLSDKIIWNGDLYTDNLPEGNYIFKITDTCGVEKTLSIFVEGYHPPEPGYIFYPQCGAFSVIVNDNSNGDYNSNYWLQKYYPSTATWGHPVTGEPYAEGAIPTPGTGIKLHKNQMKANIRLAGKFRILKKFETYGDATVVNSVCISPLGEFIYGEELTLAQAYTLECMGQPNDVYVEATGNPTAYKVIEKNGQPFLIDNGLNNIFSNLEPAEYAFSVEDFCGNIVVNKFNLINLPAIAHATVPSDMLECIDSAGGTYEFHLTEQNSVILGSLHSAMYTITYHLTQEDADNNLNPLPEYYTNVVNGQTIYVRLIHNEIEICHSTTSFKLFVGNYGNTNITASAQSLCLEESIALSAPHGFTNYLWSTGETTRTIFVTEAGIYKLITENVYENMSCDGYAEIIIEGSSAPVIRDIERFDWTYDQNKIIINVEGTGDYVYSLDGVAFQESNVFEGLENGVYTVYVMDKNGCGDASKEVVLLNYPKFFTPNGDGYHDTWRIKFSIYEPNLTVMIFDRFGKVISSFGASSEGWDGTFNGKQLPSTDYWFVVKREDGRELKGHFSMLR